MQCMLAEEFSFVALDNSGPDKSGPLRRKHIEEATKEVKGVLLYNSSLKSPLAKKGRNLKELWEQSLKIVFAVALV